MFKLFEIRNVLGARSASADAVETVLYSPDVEWKKINTNGRFMAYLGLFVLSNFHVSNTFLFHRLVSFCL
jgi:hypothetical protein